MRYGATVAAAKAGTSPEFLVQLREPGAGKDAMAHAIFHVSDVAATVAAAKAAGASMQGEVVSVPIGGMPVKIAKLVDPDGNVLELMELPKGATTCRTRNDRDGRYPMIEHVARAAALLCVSGLVAAPANAHHSFAKFDRQRSIELEGELVEVKWQNPHVQFTLRSRGDDGQVQDWRLETNSPGILRRTGVGPELESPWAIASKWRAILPSTVA